MAVYILPIQFLQYGSKKNVCDKHFLFNHVIFKVLRFDRFLKLHIFAKI